MEFAKTVVVVLAGGAGTRLWPLSRPGTPKQFLRLFGERSLLQETLLRVLPLEPSHVLVVTAADLEVETGAQLREMALPPELATILTEPCPRGTAPAIALAAAWVRDRMGPATRMIVLPADHYIGDPDDLRGVLVNALAEAAAGVNLVTLGIRPTGPETGYGYIHAPQAEARGPAAVEAFVEKPDAERAGRYLAMGNYYWNSGIFVWSCEAILRAIWHHLPPLAALVSAPWAEAQARFADAPDISIDYGVLEHASNVVMISAGFAWSDVGTWEAVAGFLRDCGRLAEPSVAVNCASVDVFSRRPVAVIGLDDVLVIDGADGLLILRKGQGQHVGMVAKVLAEQRAARHEAAPEIPRVIPKPWGQELIWAETERYVGKVLTVNQGESLSLQYHREKDETIHILRGELLFRHGEHPEHLVEMRMHPGDSFHIRTRTIHQMEAVTDCDILEVSTPELADIVRLTDRYGRAA